MKRMLKLSFLFLVMSLAVVLAGNKVLPHGLMHQIRKGVAGPNPYIVLTVPQGRYQSIVQGFEVIEDNDDESPLNANSDEEEQEADMEDESVDYESGNAEEDEELSLNDFVNDDVEPEQQLADEDEAEDKIETDSDDLDNAMVSNLKLRNSANEIQNSQANKVVITHQQAGAIMVPQEIIEIEGQSVIDEKTGQPALLLPRSVLDSIPNGSILAVMERSESGFSESRANRVIVSRRRRGNRRNVNRLLRGNRRIRVVKRANNRRRPNNSKRRRVIVVRRNNKRNGNRRKGNRRRVNRRRVYL